MALSQNPVKEIFVVDVLASETTLKTFEATASEGEVGIFNADGSDGNSTVGGFKIAAIIAGKIVVSDTYQANEVLRAFAKGYVAQTFRAIDVTPVNVVVGEEYVLNLRITNYGSLSQENFYMKHANYVVGQDGDTANVAAITAGLKASLDKNFSREEGATASTNPYFSIVDGGTELTITELDQPATLGKDEGRPIPFDITLASDSAYQAMGTVAVTAGGTSGTGTGKQVANMEYFYRGNRGDAFRDQHFPYNWGKASKSRADLAEEYAVIEIQGERQSTEFDVSVSKKEAVLCVPMSVSVIAVNAIINKLETVINQTIADLV